MIHTDHGRAILLSIWAFLCLLATVASIAAREVAVISWDFIRDTKRQSPWWHWVLGLSAFWFSGPILLGAHWFVAPTVTAFLDAVREVLWLVPIVAGGVALIGGVAFVLTRQEKEQPVPEVQPVVQQTMWGLPEDQRQGGLV